MENSRFKFRAPFYKNNEFDGFVYFEAGERIRSQADIGHFGKIEQCTGREDRNGKLVYENDIVRLTKRYHGKGRTGVIVYDPGYMRYYICVEVNDYSTEDYAFHPTRQLLEVIGNIHESEGS